MSDRDGDRQDEARSRRLFVAVPLPAPARDAVAALVESVRNGSPDGGVRWVRLDGLHLTVRFLGPTPRDRVGRVTEAVRDAVHGIAPFDVRLRGAGAYPTVQRPRAIWLGVTEGVPELSRLAGRVGDALATAGWPREERPFRAHLTVARSDGARGGPDTVGRLVAAAGDGFDVRFTADRATVFESITGRGPARYEPVAEVRLPD